MFPLFSNVRVEKVVEEVPLDANEHNEKIKEKKYFYSDEEEALMKKRCGEVTVGIKWLRKQSKIPYANRPASVVMDYTALHKEWTEEQKRKSKRGHKKSTFNSSQRKHSGSRSVKRETYSKSSSHRYPSTNDDSYDGRKYRSTS